MVRTRHASKQARRVIAALLEHAPEWCHGYALIQTTDIGAGTLYPLLMRLNDDKLLESRDEAPSSPGRPPRKGYRLTVAGIAFARERKIESLPAHRPVASAQ